MTISPVLAGMIGVGLVIAFLGALGFRINMTASLPLGVYRATSERPTRGSLVYVCLPNAAAELARQRGYLGPGSCPGGVRPIGKIVLAVPGDVVTLNEKQLRINGEPVPNSATLATDSRGRALSHRAWGNHRLSSGQLWLFTPYHRNGYDSRYFGPVNSSRVISVLRPVWTQRLRNSASER